MTVSEIDLPELYSCFPVAVEAFADELRIDPARDTVSQPTESVQLAARKGR